MDEDELRALAAEAGEQYESVRQELDALRQDAESLRQHVLPPPHEIRQLADSIRAGLILSIARQVAESMNADARYVLTNVAKFSGFPSIPADASLQALATLVAGGSVRGAASLEGAGSVTAAGGLVLSPMRLQGQGTVVAAADVATAAEAAYVVELKDAASIADRLSSEASRRAGSNAGLLLMLVLIWVVLVGIPAAELALPPEAQTVINSEIGTIGLAVALTVILGQRRH